MNNQQSAKKERYLLRKQEKEQAQLEKVNRKKNKKTFFYSLIALVAAIAIFYAGSYFSNNNPTNDQGTPEILIAAAEYDAGTVLMSDGLVQNTYEIKNTGDGDLKINSIWTSCMCTTARLRIGDKTSPEFGMHTKSSLWSEKIPPGETGYLDVTFDPAFHGPDGTGQAVRIIYLESNDPDNKYVQVKLSANVVK